jgi:hypothetical protein
MILNGVALVLVGTYSTEVELNPSIGVQNLDGFSFPLGPPVLT